MKNMLLLAVACIGCAAAAAPRADAAWPILKTYDAAHQRRIRMPLGGIGTGTISLSGTGGLVDWEIRSRPDKGWTPCRDAVHPAFVIRTKDAAGHVAARLLEGPLDTMDFDHVRGTGCLTPNHGYPRFRACTFKAAYPLAQVELADPAVPVQATLEAMNPLVRGDAAASGLPVAFLRWRIANGSSAAQTVSVAAAMPNPAEGGLSQKRVAGGGLVGVVFEHGDFRRLDGQLRGDGERFLFCAYAENAFNGGRPGLVKVRLDIPPRAASSGPLFALDVKRARRVPFDGAVEYLQVPGECAFVLIGDGRLTEVPDATVIEAGDAGNRAPLGLLPGAARALAARAALGDFREPVRVVMFDRAGEGGHAQPNFRFTACAVEQDVVTAKTFAKDRFLDSLAKAKALVFCSDVDPEESEVVFASCGDEVKDFLRRGGTILFHCCPTPDSARKLFAEIGVFDPGAHGGRVKVRDGWCSQDEGRGKDHLLYKSVRAIDTPWGRGGMLQFDHAFVKWDRERQQAFYMAKPEWRVDGKDTAMLVAQEGVLGAGKVVFEENDRAFTTWYENQIYGENLISYVIGMNVGEHVRKVRLLNGGPGEAAGD